MPSDPLNLIPVEAADDPRIADYAKIRDAELRGPGRGVGRGVFLAESDLVVRQLIASGRPVRSVLLTPRRLDAMREGLAGLARGTPIYVASQEAMDGIVGFHIHRGVLAAGVRTPDPEIDHLLARARTVVVLEGLSNHDNVGGIFRNVAALAAPPACVLLSPDCCDPLYRKAIRVSMGHALRVPFATLTPWPRGLSRVREAGFRVVALATGGPSEVPEQNPAKVALLLGSEAAGLTPGALANADERVRITMNEGVDSLNVAVAAAIALHRLCRPGGGAGGRAWEDFPSNSRPAGA